MRRRMEPFNAKIEKICKLNDERWDNKVWSKGSLYTDSRKELSFIKETHPRRDGSDLPQEYMRPYALRDHLRLNVETRLETTDHGVFHRDLDEVLRDLGESK